MFIHMNILQIFSNTYIVPHPGLGFWDRNRKDKGLHLERCSLAKKRANIRRKKKHYDGKCGIGQAESHRRELGLCLGSLACGQGGGLTWIAAFLDCCLSLFLVALGLHCGEWAFSVVAGGLFLVVVGRFSLVVAWLLLLQSMGSRALKFSSCGT